MYNRIQETRLIKQNVTVKEQLICDVCRKIIYQYDISNKGEDDIKKHRVYYWSTFRPSNCGDSDCYESYEVCSKECLCKVLLDYMEATDKDPYYMPEINIKVKGFDVPL